MKPKSIDIALLENALTAIEKVMAHADIKSPGEPCAATAAESMAALEHRFRASAAQSAVNICLSSAAALVDVSKALMGTPDRRSPEELGREWQALIMHTKIAGRCAHRAALVMSELENLPAAQGLEPAWAEEALDSCRLAVLSN
jgi:hypothetical protein